MVMQDVVYQEVLSVDVAEADASLDAVSGQMDDLAAQWDTLRASFATPLGNPFAALGASMDAVSTQLDAIQGQLDALRDPVLANVDLVNDVSPQLDAIQGQLDALRAPVTIPITTVGGGASAAETAGVSRAGVSSVERDAAAGGGGSAAGGGGLMAMLTSPQAMAVLATAAVVAWTTVGAGDLQRLMMLNVTGAGLNPAALASTTQGTMALSTQTGVSSDDLAKLEYMISSAGFNQGSDTLQVTQAAAQGAKLSGADPATVGNALTTMMNDYSLGADQATGATGQMIAAVAQGKMTMQDFAGSLQNVLPTAAQLNIPLQEILGAEAEMTAHGVAADRATTALRFTLNALSNPTATASAAMQDMGLNVQQLTQTMTSGDLTGALTQIQTAFQGMLPAGSSAAIDAAQKAIENGADPDQVAASLEAQLGPGFTKAFQDLSEMSGGARSSMAILSLIPGLDQYQADVAAIGSTSAAAATEQQAWGEYLTTFLAQWDRLTAAIGFARDEIGDALLPILTPLVKMFADDLPEAVMGIGDALNALVEGLTSDSGAFGVVGDEIEAAFGPDAANTVRPFLQWLMDNMPTVKRGLGDVSAAVADLAAGNLGGLKTDLQLIVMNVQSLAAQPWSALSKDMANFAPTGERMGSMFSGMGAGLSSIDLSPLAGLAGMTTGTNGQASALQAAQGVLGGLSGVVNGLSAALQATVSAANGLYLELSQVQGIGQSLAAGIAVLTAAWVIQQGVMLASQVPFALFAAQYYALAAAQAVATTATGIFTGAVALLNVVMDANPIMLIVVGLAALAVGLTLAYNNIQPFHDAVNGLWSAIQANPLKALGVFLSGPLGIAFAAAYMGIQPFHDAINDLTGLVGDLMSKLGALANWFTSGPWQGIQGAMSALGSAGNATGQNVQAGAASASQSAGYQSMLPQAQYASSQVPNLTGEQANNLNAVILGVGQEETALGTAGMGKTDNNLFGLYEPGDTGQTDAAGAGIYSSDQASMVAFAQLLQTPRYAGAWQDILSGNLAAVPQDLANEGYAGNYLTQNPNFLPNLTKILPQAQSAIQGHANGGWLYEPVLGVGLATGQRYAFAEAGRPEYVGPEGPGGSGSGPAAPAISVTIDARGAQEGVAEQIEKKLQQFADDLRASWNNTAVQKGALT